MLKPYFLNILAIVINTNHKISLGAGTAFGPIVNSSFHIIEI